MKIIKYKSAALDEGLIYSKIEPNLFWKSESYSKVLCFRQRVNQAASGYTTIIAINPRERIELY